MFTAGHVLVYSKDAESDRAFFRGALGLASVDAGQGWLIFALPGCELAFHPIEPGGPGDARHELWFMCADIGRTIDRLSRAGARNIAPVVDHGWGLASSLETPAGSRLSLYQPRHATAFDLARSKSKPASRGTRKPRSARPAKPKATRARQANKKNPKARRTRR